MHEEDDVMFYGPGEPWGRGRRGRRHFWFAWPPAYAGAPLEGTWTAPAPGPFPGPITMPMPPMPPGAVFMASADEPQGRRGPRGGRRGGPWGGGGPWGAWGRGGPRARRGDVRAAVLTLLAEQPMHGYQLIQELEQRSGGAWRPSPGSIYPTLQLLEDEGLVAAEQVSGKKVFSLTAEGRQELERLQQHEGAPPWEGIADDGGGSHRQLKQGVGQLAAAAMQVARTGHDDQVRRALDILNDARKKLYTILAEET
jgi:DNA-binding PadR family transcriptional regulator